jgi:prophage regulatory protein
MQLLKMAELSRRYAEPRSTLYWRIGLGTFVPPIKQGPRAAAFILEEVETLLRARAAGASDEEIKALVRKLVADRKGTALAADGAEFAATA